MSANPIPVVPVVATDTNYPAGVSAWSATPTKVAPDAGYQADGWVPDQPVPAQYENFHKFNVCAALSDAQAMATFRVLASGSLTSAGTSGFIYAVNSKLVFVKEADGASGLHPYSPDFKRSGGAVAWTINAADTGPVMWSYGTNAGANKVIAVPIADGAQQIHATTITDANPPVVNPTGLTLGGANNDIWDIVRDEFSGRVLMLRAGTLTSTQGSAVITNALPTTGWSKYSQIAYKTGTAEVRAFLLNPATPESRTMAATDGSTMANPATMTWNGGAWAGAAGAKIFRPCWDVVRSRWICTTGDASSGALATIMTALAASSQMWTSPDGVAWTAITAPPGLHMVQIKYYRGWLWGIGVCAQDHGGLEIFASRDGGVTWMRPGIILGLYSGLSYEGFTTFSRLCGIQVAGANLIFWYSVDGNQPFNYVVLAVDSTL